MKKYATYLDVHTGLKVEIDVYDLPKAMPDGSLGNRKCHLVTLHEPSSDLCPAQRIEMEPMTVIQLHRWLTEHIDELVVLAQKAKERSFERA
jgi:hypothetical protein